MSEQTSNPDLVAELAEEFVDRYRKGERPPLSEYVRNHPELADEIKEVFPALVMIEGLAPQHDASIVGDEPESAPAAPAVVQLGDYRILREVGRGGMGIVYEAEQVSLGRHVALKVLPQSLLSDQEQKLRFEREAKAAAKLHHTNIVPVFGVGEHDGMHYYVMQFIQGLGLDEVLIELKRMQNSSSSSTPSAEIELPVQRRGGVAAKDVARSLLTGTYHERPITDDPDSSEAHDCLQPTAPALNPSPSVERVSRPNSGTARSAQLRSIALPGQTSSEVSASSHSKKLTYWQSVATIGVQVASALQHAHDQGIQHRDIKPSNLLLDLRGTVWVTDFGLAKTDDQQDLTQTGDILGTLRYMPAEAFEGKADHRSDLYSLGITLYEMLALKPAFKERDRNKLIKLVTQEAPQRLDKLSKDAPRDLVTIIHKAIERDAGHRYPSGRDLAEDLQRFIDDEPIRARRISLVERFGRWSRRNKALAASLSTVALLVLLVTVGALVAAGHFRQQEQRQRELAETNQDLANEKEAQRKVAEQQKELAEQRRREAEGARAAEARLKDDAINAATRETRLKVIAENQKELAEQRRREARLQFYASDTSNASHASRSADQHARINSYLDRWRNETYDPRDWEHYFLQTQIQFPTVELSSARAHGGAGGIMRAVDWSPDGSRIVTGSTIAVEVFDASFGERRWRRWLRSGAATVAWSPDGGRIACGTEDGRIIIVTAATGDFVGGFSPHATVSGVRWSLDGSRLVTCGGAEIKVWDASTRQLLRKLDGHTSRIVGVAWDPKSERIAACAVGGAVRIWEAVSGELRNEWQHGSNVAAWAWSPDAGQMAFASRAAADVVIWDVAAKKVVQRFRDARLRAVKDLAWSPDGAKLATTGGGTRTLWSIQTGKLLDKAAQVEMNALAWSDNGESLAAVGDDATVLIWPAHRTARPRLIANATKFHWGAAGGYFATSAGKAVTIWDADRWNKLQTLGEHQGNVTALCLSPDERLLASADEGKNLYLWDWKTGKNLRHLKDFDALVANLAFSPDQKWLSAVEGSRLHVWETEAWRKSTVTHLGFLPGQPFQTWSADSRYLLSAAREMKPGRFGTCGLWDATQKRWQNFAFHTGGPLPAAWKPDGKRVALVLGFHRIVIFDVNQEGKPNFTELGLERDVSGAHGKQVIGLDWSANGRRLVSVGEEKRARVWDVDTLQQVHEIDNALDARWGPFGVRIAVRTPEGVEIHDASVGAARSRWKQLLPLLKHKLKLGRITAADRRTMAEIHAHHQQWQEALAAVAALQKLHPNDPRSTHCAAETFDKVATALSAEGRHDEARAFLKKSRDVHLQNFRADPRAPHHVVRLTNASLALSQPKWSVAKPIGMTSKGGETLTLEKDGSIFVSGPNPGRAVYTVKLPVGNHCVTALRLETLPDVRLPHGGAGRYFGNGNFHLTELAVALASGDNSELKSIPIANVSADFRNHPDFAATKAVDGDPKTRWDTDPQLKVPHWAIFAFESPVQAEDGRLIVTLDSGSYAYGKHGLGRFRLSVTTDPQPLRSSALKNLTDPWAKLGAAVTLEGSNAEGNPSQTARLLAQVIESAPDAKAKAKIAEQAIANEDVFAALVELEPKNPTYQIERGKHLASKGKWDAAAAEFERAKALDGKSMPKWIQTGFWKVGPYPVDLQRSYAPERNPNPFHPVASDDDNQAMIEWQSVMADGNGRIDLGTGRGCNYVLTRVWSPTKQEVAFHLGDDDALRLFVNNEFLFETKPDGNGAKRNEHQFAVTLQPGWSTVLLKVQNESAASNVIITLCDSAFCIRHARLGTETYRAERLLAAGKRHEAEPLLKKVSAEHAQLATTLSAYGDGYISVAVRHFQKAIQLDAGNAVAHNNWAWLLVRKPGTSAQNAAAAVKLAKRACDLDPKSSSWWNTLGVAHYRAGDWRSALNALQESEKLRGDHPANALFLAMTHWRSNDKMEARTWYDKALDWRKKNKPDAELRTFYGEAENLFGK